jgi:hypothetical protein
MDRRRVEGKRKKEAHIFKMCQLFISHFSIGLYRISHKRMFLCFSYYFFYLTSKRLRFKEIQWTWAQVQLILKTIVFSVTLTQIRWMLGGDAKRYKLWTVETTTRCQGENSVLFMACLAFLFLFSEKKGKYILTSRSRPQIRFWTHISLSLGHFSH